MILQFYLMIQQFTLIRVAILKKGRLVKINKCKNDWCKIKTGEFKGWLKKIVYGDYYKQFYFIYLDHNLSKK